MGIVDLSAIRRARSTDLDALIALENAAFPRVDRFPRRTWRRLLTRRSAPMWVLADGDAATVNDSLCAAIAWLLRAESCVARMYSLAVHPRARGRGLARHMIVRSVDLLPRRCTMLSLEVRSGNAAAIGLYRSLGFRPCAGLAAYYDDDGHGDRDGMRMRCAREALVRISTHRAS